QRQRDPDGQADARHLGRQHLHVGIMGGRRGADGRMERRRRRQRAAIEPRRQSPMEPEGGERDLANYGMNFYDSMAKEGWTPVGYDQEPFGFYPLPGKPK